MVPNSQHYNYTFPVKVNTLGLPSSELETKSENEHRILALGDSFVYGQGVASEMTIPAKLERHLNDKYGESRYRVVNSGHPGYATNQELALLRELGPSIDPDTVILFWFHNDLEDADIVAITKELESTGRTRFGVTEPLKGSLLRRWNLKQFFRKSASLMMLHDALAIVRSEPLSGDVVAAGLARLRGHFNQLAEIAEQQNYRVVVAIIPDPNALVGDHWSILVGEQVADYAQLNGFKVISLLEVGRQIYREKNQMPIVPFDGHYDQHANNVFAEAVGDQLDLVMSSQGN